MPPKDGVTPAVRSTCSYLLQRVPVGHKKGVRVGTGVHVPSRSPPLPPPAADSPPPTVLGYRTTGPAPRPLPTHLPPRRPEPNFHTVPAPSSPPPPPPPPPNKDVSSADIQEAVEVLRAARVLPGKPPPAIKTPVQSPLEPMVSAVRTPPPPVIVAHADIDIPDHFGEDADDDFYADLVEAAPTPHQRFPVEEPPPPPIPDRPLLSVPQHRPPEAMGTLPWEVHRPTPTTVLPSSDLPYSSEVRVYTLDPTRNFGIVPSYEPDGVYIDSITPQGQAEELGLPSDGRIIALHGRKINSRKDLEDAVAASRSHGGPVDITIDCAAVPSLSRPPAGVGQQVRCTQDEMHLLSEVRGHPNLTCDTEQEEANYRRLAGQYGVVQEESRSDSTVLVVFPKPLMMQAWLPLSTINEIDPPRGTSGVHDAIAKPRRYNIMTDPAGKLNANFVESYPVDQATFARMYRRSKELGVPLIPPTTYQPPKLKRLDISRGKMGDYIDSLDLGVNETAKGIKLSLRAPPETPPDEYDDAILDTDDPVGYGYDPRSDRIMLNDTRAEHGKHPLGADELELYPPAGYPHYEISIEEDLSSEETHQRGLDTFVEEMYQFYDKVSPESYRHTVENLLLNGTCPPELVGFFTKQLDLIDQGKDPRVEEQEDGEKQKKEKKKKKKKKKDKKEKKKKEKEKDPGNDSESSYERQVEKYVYNMYKYHEKVLPEEYRQYIETRLSEDDDLAPEIMEFLENQLELLDRGANPFPQGTPEVRPKKKKKKKKKAKSDEDPPSPESLSPGSVE